MNNTYIKGRENRKLMDFHLWRLWLSFVLILLEDSQFSDQPSSDVQHNLMIIVYSIRTHASESVLNCASPSLEGLERDTRYSTKTTITGCRKIRTHPSVLPNPLSFSAPRQSAHIVGRYITLTVIHRPDLCGMGPALCQLSRFREGLIPNGWQQ